jgi:hypothetical protein
MHSFTPGPWFAVRNSCYWEVNPAREQGDYDTPFTVADCCASDPGDTTGLQEANARLIAAAPGLLAALVSLRGGDLWTQDAEDAIAKATGETP